VAQKPKVVTPPKPKDPNVAANLPGGFRMLTVQGAKAKVSGQLAAAKQTAGSVLTGVKDAVVGAGKDIKAGVSNPVEAAKGFFKGAQNMWRDSFDAGGQLVYAANHGGKTDVFAEKRSERPENQPQNAAQRAGSGAWDVVSAAVSYDPFKGGGKGAKGLQPALATVSSSERKVAAQTIGAGTRLESSGGKVVSGSTKATAAAKTAQAIEPAAAKKASAMAEQFRVSHGLKKGADEVHDLRHVLLGKSTTSAGENAVNSAEKTLFPELAKASSTRAFVGNKAALQNTFEGYMKSRTGSAADSRTLVKRFQNNEISFEKLVGGDSKSGFKGLKQLGIYNPNDKELAKVAAKAEKHIFDDKNMGKFLTKYVETQTRALSRTEALKQFKEAIRSVAVLEEKNKVSPGAIVNGTKSISYDVNSETVSRGLANVEAGLSKLK
jgi:hypothetical protein